eukprot:Em0003g780a
MNSPTPIPCHHLPSSSEAALSHVLKTEDFMTPYPYEQPFNHHLCFDPNFQQSDGLNVTGLMRIMPFPLPPGTITFGQPHGGLHGDTLLMAHHCSPEHRLGAAVAKTPQPPLCWFPDHFRCRQSWSEQDTQSYLGNSCQDGIFPSGFGEKFGCSGTSSLKWQAHIPNSWVTLCDETLQEIVVKRENTPSSAQLSPQMDFQVEADKGFIFLSVTTHISECCVPQVPKYVKLKDDIFHPIEMFVLVLHGVKFECVDSTIQIEYQMILRSQSGPPYAVCIQALLCSGAPVCSDCPGNHTVVSHISERIIVNCAVYNHEARLINASKKAAIIGLTIPAREGSVDTIMSLA